MRSLQLNDAFNQECTNPDIWKIIAYTIRHHGTECMILANCTFWEIGNWSCATNPFPYEPQKLKTITHINR